jgi:hypothetical protein
MGEKNGSPTRNVVQAKKIVEALTQEDGDAVYVLRDAQVVGKLDLKHRVVHAAVDIQRCTFLDPADLRSCTFEQTVNFSGCIFRRRFSGAELSGSYTIFKKNLVCNGATFHGAMRLVGGQVEGSAYFRGAKFLNKDQKISFAWASIGGTLELAKVTFRGPANFNSVKCEGAGFFWGESGVHGCHVQRPSILQQYQV